MTKGEKKYYTMESLTEEEFPRNRRSVRIGISPIMSTHSEISYEELGSRIEEIAGKMPNKYDSYFLRLEREDYDDSSEVYLYGVELEPFDEYLNRKKKWIDNQEERFLRAQKAAKAKADANLNKKRAEFERLKKIFGE